MIAAAAAAAIQYPPIRPTAQDYQILTAQRGRNLSGAGYLKFARFARLSNFTSAPTKATSRRRRPHILTGHRR